MNDKKKLETEPNPNDLKEVLKELVSENRHYYSIHNSAVKEVDLIELWKIIWKQKLMIIAITLVFAIGSVFYALSLSDEYKSTVILTPTSSSGGSSLSKLAGKFGGLASLAGVNLGGGENKSIVAMEILKTWGFIEQFVKENHMEVEVFAATGWNRSTDKLIIDPEMYDEINNKWVRTDFDPGKGQTAKPSGWELYEEFAEKISISEDKMSGLVTLSVKSYSPHLAKERLELLVIAINSHMKQYDKTTALQSIEYLKKQINQTNIAEMHSIFYELIAENTKTLLLAEIGDDYVFKIISPAKVPFEKSGPKRALIVILGTLLGGIIACFFVMFKNYATPQD